MDDDILAKIREYAARTRRVIIDENVGSGIHGSVVLLESDVQPGFTVLKMHFEEGSYLRERDVYLHLRDQEWHSVCGCDIPYLIACDDAELTLELSAVEPPYVLDFGQSYLYWRPEFSDDVWEATYEKWREVFGDDWGKASAILDAFEAIDVYMLDPTPSNFRFR